jgi:uncharacterized PurR-regulated membrane protein YhhQ (DUF165 family)
VGKVDRFEAEIENDGRRLVEGLLFLALYCLTIPVAIYLTANIGFDCGENGPCKVPVAPGFSATSGAFVIGAAFVLRDYVQRRIGIGVSACAVVMGAALGGYLVSPGLAMASTVALLIAGFADLAVYTLLARKRFVSAVVVSSIISATIDSGLVLWLGFQSLELFPGQLLAKVWLILLAVPFTIWLMKRDERIGLQPA